MVGKVRSGIRCANLLGCVQSNASDLAILFELFDKPVSKCSCFVHRRHEFVFCFVVLLSPGRLSCLSFYYTSSVGLHSWVLGEWICVFSSLPHLYAWAFGGIVMRLFVIFWHPFSSKLRVGILVGLFSSLLPTCLWLFVPWDLRFLGVCISLKSTHFFPLYIQSSQSGLTLELRVKERSSVL